MELISLLVGYVLGASSAVVLLGLCAYAYRTAFPVHSGGVKSEEMVQQYALPYIAKDDAREAQLEREFLANAEVNMRKGYNDEVPGLGK